MDKKESELKAIRPMEFAEIVGVKAPKGKGQETAVFSDIGTENTYSDMLFYAHFNTESEQIVNLVNEEKMAVEGPFKYDELADGSPLLFEDDYQQKIKKVLSVKVEKGNLKDLLGNLAYDTTKILGFEFWFFPYKEGPYDLLTNAGKLLSLGVLDKAVILTVNQTVVFHDKGSKVCQLVPRAWNHVLLQISADDKLELFFNAKLSFALKDLKMSFAGLKTDKLQFLPNMDGEVTEIRVSKVTIDEKELAKRYKLPHPKIFDEEKEMKIKVKMNRNKNKSQKSLSLTAPGLSALNTSMDGSVKLETKKSLMISKPNDSKVITTGVSESSSTANPPKKMTQSSVQTPVTVSKMGSLRAQLRMESNKRLSGRKVNADPLNASKLMGSQSEIGRSTRSLSLSKPKLGSLFKDYFDLSPEEKSELEREDVIGLIQANNVSKFLRIFILHFMRQAFNDEFDTGVTTATQSLQTIFTQKNEPFYQIVPYIVKVIVYLSLCKEIKELVSREPNPDLESIIYKANFVANCKITDQMYMIVMTRLLPYFTKADNYAMAKKIIQRIDEVNSTVERFPPLHDAVPGKQPERPGQRHQGKTSAGRQTQNRQNYVSELQQQSCFRPLPRLSRVRPQFRRFLRSWLKRSAF